MFTFQLKAQTSSPTVHYYYIEEASYDLLKPNNTITKSNNTLELQFQNQNLTDFFSNLNIHTYHREFAWSKSTYFHRYYIIGLDSDDMASHLESISEIVSAEYTGDLRGGLLDTPNDYYNHETIQNRWINAYQYTQSVHVTSPRGYEHLELVKARQAWNITTGSPSVAIGVVDTEYNIDHPDLINKITHHYGTVWNGFGDRQHGTRVAGVAAGDTNNGVGISSIGYDSSLITSRYNIPGITLSREGTFLYLIEQHPEIKVINISWYDSNGYNDTKKIVYDSIVEHHNVTVIAAAGNAPWGSPGTSSTYYYPQSYDNVISVSSVSSYQDYGTVSDNGQQWGWKDVHDFFIDDTLTNHQHHDKVDLVAPGHLVPGPNRFDEYMLSTGTSFAAPMVAGTAALMYAVHPTITPADVKQILQDTADDIYHIPENQNYIGKLGAGRLNAYAAVLQAKCLANNTPGLDLIMHNTDIDYGEEPDVDSDVIWNSPDIWVRNQPDGVLYQTSEDLHYENDETPVYVYVKVTNNSCEVSSGNDLLKLYWAKGGLYQQWPNVWNGNSNLNPITPIGNLVNTQNIPSLSPGKSTILEFQWQPLDPQAYENLGFLKPWMFCFLSRIVTATDPMTFPEGSNPAENTRNNNNIAYHNATVINLLDTDSEGSLVVGNVGGSSAITTDVEFFTNTTADNTIWQEAEVRIRLDGNLWNLWQNSGALSNHVRVLDPNQRLILLTANHASLNNISMQPDDWGIATVGVNFLITQVDMQEEYDLHVQQVNSTSQESLGGFSFTFERDNQRQAFNAQTNRVANTDGSETFHAGNINENAIYNWYDEEGNLIYSGTDFTVNNTIAQEYKLEVIAEADGHKDYKTVITEDKRGIDSISPNPATSSTVVGFTLADDDTAFIMLTHTSSGMYYNYIINSENNSITIPTSQLAQGQYVVNLIANGVILDAKHLVIN